MCFRVRASLLTFVFDVGMRVNDGVQVGPTCRLGPEVEDIRRIVPVSIGGRQNIHGLLAVKIPPGSRGLQVAGTRSGGHSPTPGRFWG